MAGVTAVVLAIAGIAPAPAAANYVATAPPVPSAPTPASLQSIMPAATQIVAASGTIWSKAAEIRNLVRASLPPGTSCGTLAEGFWSVGTLVGLPLRIVQLSANGRNGYDTHVTVEVWDSSRSQWEISDPTFNGYWTRGPDGPPVGVAQIHDAVLQGTAQAFVWHGAGTTNSIVPSDYYVDPIYLFRWAEVEAYVAGQGLGYLVDQAADSFSSSEAFVPSSPTDLGTLPPAAQVPVDVTATPSLSQTSYAAPPAYAGALVFNRDVTVGGDGSVKVPLGPLGTAAILVVDSAQGEWELNAAAGTYELDDYSDARVSPIAGMSGGVELNTTAAAGETVRVRVWAVQTFPATQQGPDDWSSPAPTLSYPSPAAKSLSDSEESLTVSSEPSGVPGEVYIDYGPTASYGTTVGPLAVNPQRSTWTGTVDLTNLAPASTYHWRARFIDTGVTVATGADERFITSAVPVGSPPPVQTPPPVPTSPPVENLPTAPPPPPVPAPTFAQTARLTHALMSVDRVILRRLCGRRARVARAGRVSVEVSASTAGMWSFVLSTATTRRHRHSTRLASGSWRLRAPGKERVVIQLTRAGEAVLAAHGSPNVAVQMIVTPASGSRGEVTQIGPFCA